MSSPFRLTRGVAYTKDAVRGYVNGAHMTGLVIDVVLFSCLFAFVTGVVIAAANLLI